MISFSVRNITPVILVLFLTLFGISCKQSNSTEPHGGTTGTNPGCLITASPDTLPIGGGKVTLLWTSHNASSAKISPGVGTVGTSGVTTVTVTKTTMYVLTVSNGGSTASDSILVVVSTPGGLTCTFTASPNSLPFGGGSVTLSWTSQVASAATISPGIGDVPTSGDTTIQVNQTTPFILTISNNGYSLSDTVTVTVTPTWQFNYPLARGKSWTFDYNYYYSASTMTKSIHGTHTWSVISRDSLYGHVTYQVVDDETDTTFTGTKQTVQNTSKSFTILVTQDSIFVNWTNLARMSIPPSVNINHLPRFISTRQDTVTLGTVPQAEYATGVGMIRYTNGSATAQSITTESMVLVSRSGSDLPDVAVRH